MTEKEAWDWIWTNRDDLRGKGKLMEAFIKFAHKYGKRPVSNKNEDIVTGNPDWARVAQDYVDKESK